MTYSFAWEALLIGISIFRRVLNTDILNSLLFHKVETKEIWTVTMFRYLILISIDFYTILFLHFLLNFSFH